MSIRCQRRVEVATVDVDAADVRCICAPLDESSQCLLCPEETITGRAQSVTLRRVVHRLSRECFVSQRGCNVLAATTSAILASAPTSRHLTNPGRETMRCNRQTGRNAKRVGKRCETCTGMRAWTRPRAAPATAGHHECASEHRWVPLTYSCRASNSQQRRLLGRHQFVVRVRETRSTLVTTTFGAIRFMQRGGAARFFRSRWARSR